MNHMLTPTRTLTALLVLIALVLGTCGGLVLTSEASAQANPQYPTRPFLSGKTFTECSKHFCGHWALQGEDRVASKDADSNGTPDYVDAVLEASEKSRLTYIKSGFLAPLKDHRDGDLSPNRKIDIYFKTIANGFRGTTYPEFKDGVKLDSGFMEFTNSAYAQGVMNTYKFRGQRVSVSDFDQMRALASHEVFHLVQYAYGQNLQWGKEGQADWATTLVYPEFAYISQLNKLHNGHSWKTPNSFWEDGHSDYEHSPLNELLQRNYGKDTNSAILRAGGVANWMEAEAGRYEEVMLLWAKAKQNPAKFFKHGDLFPSAPTTSTSCDGAERSYELRSSNHRVFAWDDRGRVQVNLATVSASDHPLFVEPKTEWMVLVRVTRQGSVVSHMRQRLQDGDDFTTSVRLKKSEVAELTVINLRSTSSHSGNPSDGTATESHPQVRMTLSR